MVSVSSTCTRVSKAFLFPTTPFVYFFVYVFLFRSRDINLFFPKIFFFFFFFVSYETLKVTRLWEKISLFCVCLFVLWSKYNRSSSNYGQKEWYYRGRSLSSTKERYLLFISLHPLYPNIEKTKSSRTTTTTTTTTTTIRDKRRRTL